jgi:nitroreductase
MELRDAMRSMHACRFFTPEPVPDAVFHQAVEAARFAPNGGNRQGVRFVIVRDAEKKRRLGELNLPPWQEVAGAARAGMQAITTESGVEKSAQLGFSNIPKALDEGDHFAQHFGEHPTIVVVCMDRNEMHPTDTELDRLSIVGGASVYPMTQNFCLCLREQGVATSFTTLLVACEPEVKALLDIPEDFITACHIAVGYPERPFPTKLRRRPVEELAFVDSFGSSLTL